MADSFHHATGQHPMPYWRQCTACLGWGVVRTVATQALRDQLLSSVGWRFTPRTGTMLCPECFAKRQHPDRVITDIP